MRNVVAVCVPSLSLWSAGPDPVLMNSRALPTAGFELHNLTGTTSIHLPTTNSGASNQMYVRTAHSPGPVVPARLARRFSPSVSEYARTTGAAQS
jgi:hypothetical protein